MKETDIGKSALIYFSEFGWEVYQEVQTRFGNIVDMIVKMDKIIHCVELKTTFSLDVIYQAYFNKTIGNYSSVIVPQSHTRGDFVERICRDYGIGVYYINIYDNSIRQKVPPKLTRRVCKIKLSNEQKHYAEAGNSYGKRWSPYLETKKNLISQVTKSKGIKLKDLLKQVPHHYCNDITAVASIKKWIGTSALPELKLIDGIVYLKDYELING
jgi:hypothetical protein